MSMNWLPNGQHLKADDLREEKGQAILVTIRDLVEEIFESDGRKEAKHVMYFEEIEQGLVLNVTNGTILRSMWNKPANAIGQKIVLYLERTTFQGRPTDGIRVRAPKNQPSPVGPTPEEIQEAQNSDITDF